MPSSKGLRRGIPQVTGREGRLDDEIGPIHVFGGERTRVVQITGEEGRLGDEIGPIHVYHPEGNQGKGRLR